MRVHLGRSVHLLKFVDWKALCRIGVADFRLELRFRGWEMWELSSGHLHGRSWARRVFNQAPDLCNFGSKVAFCFPGAGAAVAVLLLLSRSQTYSR